MPSWEVTGVVPGGQFATTSRERSLVHSDGDESQYLWKGFSVELFRDAAETYWFNLTGGRPSLFVICECREEGELVPTTVTADHSHSQGAIEADGASFAVPIPPEIHRQLEEFVMAHYRPEPPRKRKRRDWRKEDTR